MKSQWISSMLDFLSLPAALIVNIIFKTRRIKTASDNANIEGVSDLYLSLSSISHLNQHLVRVIQQICSGYTFDRITSYRFDH